MNPFEEVVWDLFGEEVMSEQGLPPGFRFHPTDEELVTFYLASKVFNGGLCGLDIIEVDLNRCEPWELPDVAKMGEREWYFFSLRDRKYPTGLRTNRATGAGYWKATGKDREVHAAAANGSLVGMKKTLVFYKGRAPRGEKTKWVLHEYRLDGDYSCRHSCKEEWVICRIFNKSSTGGADHNKKNPHYPDPSYYNHHLDHPPLSSPTSSGLLPPLPQLQSIESPLIHSLLQNHTTTTTTSPLLPLPQSLDPSSSSLLTLHEKEEEEEEEGGGGAPFSNWLDAYYYDMLLPFGGGGGGGGGGASSHHDVSSIF